MIQILKVYQELETLINMGADYKQLLAWIDFERKKLLLYQEVEKKQYAVKNPPQRDDYDINDMGRQ